MLKEAIAATVLSAGAVCAPQQTLCLLLSDKEQTTCTDLDTFEDGDEVRPGVTIEWTKKRTEFVLMGNVSELEKLTSLTISCVYNVVRYCPREDPPHDVPYNVRLDYYSTCGQNI